MSSAESQSANHQVTADSLRSQGKLDEALVEYEKAIELNPRNHSALSGKGIILYARGSHEQAVSIFTQALEIDYKDADAHFWKGISLYETQQYAEALVSLELAIQMNAKNHNAWNYIGNIHKMQQNMQQALNAYRKAEETSEGKDAQAHYNMASLLGESGQVDEAVSHYEKAAEIDNSLECDVWNNLAQLFNQTGQPEKALTFYDKVVAKDPSYSNAHFNKAVLLQDIDGRLGEALASIEAFLTLCPTEQPQAWKAKASMLLRLNRPQEAIQALRQSLVCLTAAGVSQNDPADTALTYNSIASILLSTRPEDRAAKLEALEAFEKAIELQDTDATTQFNRGVVLKDLERYAEASQAFDRALALDPNHSQAAFAKAIVARHLGDQSSDSADGTKSTQDPVESWNRVIEMDPSNGNAWAQKGMELHQQGHKEEASQCFAKAVELSPQEAGGYLGLGVECVERREFDAALDHLEKAIQLRPDLAEAHINRAVILYSKKRYDEAEASYNAALQLDPLNVSAIFGLGLVYHAVGKSEEAIEQLDKILSVSPNLVLAHTLRGEALVKLGRVQEAVQSFRAVLKIDPENGLAQRNLRMLLNSDPTLAEYVKQLEEEEKRAAQPNEPEPAPPAVAQQPSAAVQDFQKKVQEKKPQQINAVLSRVQQFEALIQKIHKDAEHMRTHRLWTE